MQFLNDQAKREKRLYDEGNSNSLRTILNKHTSQIEQFANSSASNINVDLYQMLVDCSHFIPYLSGKSIGTYSHSMLEPF